MSFKENVLRMISSLLLIGIVNMFFPLKLLAGPTYSIDIWWPTDNAVVSGSQPLKALLSGLSVDKYEMFWQVDNGQWNRMQSNYQDYPHKEVIIELSGWTWKGIGPYLVNFIAQDSNGEILSQRTVKIYTGTPAETQTQIETQVQTQTQIQVQPIYSINILWPQNGAHVSGTQELKANLENQPQDSYKMFWQVDGDKLNSMQNGIVSVDFSGWNWKGSGPYLLNFLAQNLSGSKLAEKSVSIYTGSGNTNTTPITPAPLLTGTKLYVDPNNAAQKWINANASNRPGDAELMKKIAPYSQGFWLGGWNYDVTSDVRNLVGKSASQGTVPTLVLYNIPQRDCGQYSAGGLANQSAYLAWIQSVASGIGQNQAFVVLEPDVLALMDCLSSDAKNARFEMINKAIDILKTQTKAKIYVDAGHANWIDSNTMSARLQRAGVAKADGFSLNVSNFVGQTETVNYGNRVSSLTNGKHFVIDTGRNGNGTNGEWCNPRGRALGLQPTVLTNSPTIDAFLWVKPPGESDGWCNGGPSAGTFWPEYALDLARNTK